MRIVLLAALGTLAGTAAAQTLHYEAEWRLMHSGNAELQLNSRDAVLRLETAGLAGKLYKVDNRYTVQFDEQYCASSSVMMSHEGSKRREVKISYNQRPGKVEMVERDLIKDEVLETKEIDAPACVHDLIAGLGRLRGMKLEPGTSLELPLTNGNKAALAKVEVEKRETVKTPVGEFETIRLQAHVYNGVIYRRKAKLLVWLTTDEKRLPVQIRVELGFFIGTVTLKLEKEDRS